MTKRDSRLDCDVIIVNFNAGKLLSECVSSAAKASIGKCIIVDNASTDESIKYLSEQALYDQLLIIENSQNNGFASACNTGISASSASRLLFLNPDSMLMDGALNRMVEVLDSAKDIGMVGGLSYQC